MTRSRFTAIYWPGRDPTPFSAPPTTPNPLVGFLPLLLCHLTTSKKNEEEILGEPTHLRGS